MAPSPLCVLPGLLRAAKFFFVESPLITPCIKEAPPAILHSSCKDSRVNGIVMRPARIRTPPAIPPTLPLNLAMRMFWVCSSNSEALQRGKIDTLSLQPKLSLALAFRQHSKSGAALSHCPSCSACCLLRCSAYVQSSRAKLDEKHSARPKQLHLGEHVGLYALLLSHR